MPITKKGTKYLKYLNKLASINGVDVVNVDKQPLHIYYPNVIHLDNISLQTTEGKALIPKKYHKGFKHFHVLIKSMVYDKNTKSTKEVFQLHSVTRLSSDIPEPVKPTEGAIWYHKASKCFKDADSIFYKGDAMSILYNVVFVLSKKELSLLKFSKSEKKVDFNNYIKHMNILKTNDLFGGYINITKYDIVMDSIELSKELDNNTSIQKEEVFDSEHFSNISVEDHTTNTYKVVTEIQHKGSEDFNKFVDKIPIDS